VLATYKAKQPDELSARWETLRLLASLDPKDSNDSETSGIGRLRSLLEKYGHLFRTKA
jgi:hypothetical protein